MSHFRSYALVCLCLATLTVCAAGSAWAIPGICINRTPAPPDAALNDGLHSVTFNFDVEYNTTCSSYLFEMIDPSNAVIFSTAFPCAPKPTQFIWPVPLNQTPGCYYGRLTFFSNWCSGFPAKFEDQATTGFLIKPCTPVTVCKWEDIDGDGNRDPGEPLLPGWVFRLESPLGTVIRELTTGQNGCVSDCIPVEPTGSTTYYIREIVQPGWEQTFPATNPFQVSLQPGVAQTFYFGNWRPVFISGYKYLDQAPWPWTDPHYVGPNGEQNPPEWEPVPPCPGALPPADCFTASSIQPDPVPIEGVVVNLWNEAHTQQLGSTVTDSNGKFLIGPVHFAVNQLFIIEEENPAPIPSECDTHPEEGGLLPWPGEYVSTVATSVWPSWLGPVCPNVRFDTPDRLNVQLIPVPVVRPEYGCNYFFNWQPCRLWGMICQETLVLMKQTSKPLPNNTIELRKLVDSVPYQWPMGNPNWDPNSGFYQVDPISPPETEGIRQGVYRLTPPAPLDPTNFHWEVTEYCTTECLTNRVTFDLPASGYVDVVVPHSCDVRVDFCLQKEKNETRCYLPVTFTQQGWHDFCDINSPIIPGGMVYTKFPKAFAKFTFWGTTYANKLLVGKSKTITFEGTTQGLKRLCLLLPQTGPCGKLDTSYLNPWSSTPAGALAGEVVALQMNIAYNDKRLMPRTPGYDLEDFRLRTGYFKGKTVGEVLVIADRVLSGEAPCSFGLPTCEDLLAILENINRNYEFVDMQTFNDRGYLMPNVPLGPSGPGHDPSVPP